jgi:hypothetical protein
MFKHGHSQGDYTFNSWRQMKNRCTNSRDCTHWHLYGGANPPVQVCARWLNSFEAFLEDLGERTEGRTLGRFGDINNYSCGKCEQCRANGWKLNCAWQTPKEQHAEQKMKRALAFLAA